MFCFFFFTDTAPTEIYTLSLHDALPISQSHNQPLCLILSRAAFRSCMEREFSEVSKVSSKAKPFFIHHSHRSEEHTSELQSRFDLVCRLLLEKKKHKHQSSHASHPCYYE